jgi:hypothetical protein
MKVICLVRRSSDVRMFNREPQRPRSKSIRSLVISVTLLGSCAGVGEIGGPSGEPSGAPAVSSTLLAPPRVGFEVVADAMQPTCGTLDCHGQIGRNLSLFGGRGLRLDPKGSPAEDSTTAAEYDATYWSTLGLEPEIISEVVGAKGARPERLTLIRKGRGTEKHKGGTLMTTGDDLDRCLVSWLADAVDDAPCRRAAKVGSPIPPTME